MSRAFRMAAAAYAGVALIFAVGFGFQMSWATRMWPWADGRLSFIFISSILAAIAGSLVAWIITDEPAAGQAFCLDTLVAASAGSIYFLRVYDRDGEGQVLTAAIVFALAALVSGGLAVWTFRYRFRDTVPTPPLVRWSFAGFVVALVITGGALVAQAENIFPWPLKPESSTLFGLVFLGAAVYFLHAVLVPYRNNAKGQLLGFLAYDVVLIVPFLRHIPDVADDHRTSLIVYTSVVVYSGVLAAYYLFVSPRMRLFTPGQPRERAEAAT